MALHPFTLAVRAALREAALPEEAPKMQKYMKSEIPYFGVNLWKTNKITKEIIKQVPVNTFSELEQIVHELYSPEGREEYYVGDELATHYKEWHTLEALPLYRFMIETVQWWDVVDSVAAHLVGDLLRNYPDKMKPEMERWINDPNLWIRRAAILSQLTFKTNTDQEMLFRFCLEHLEEKTFWMRKAIGWSLREYSKHNPDSVRLFVEEHRSKMSGVTLREAEKYIYPKKKA